MDFLGGVGGRYGCGRVLTAEAGEGGGFRGKWRRGGVMFLRYSVY